MDKRENAKQGRGTFLALGCCGRERKSGLVFEGNWGRVLMSWRGGCTLLACPSSFTEC